MTHLEYLQDFAAVAITRLERVRSGDIPYAQSFTISCELLDDYNDIDIRESTAFGNIFDQIKNINGPVVYWFEIISDTGSLAIIEALRRYQQSASAKATPELTAAINYGSKTLYVGKAKGAFIGTLIRHLGFYKLNAVQGLQLFYWAKGLSLQLKVTLVEFEANMSDILPVFEYAFAQRLQPIIGNYR